MNKLNKISLSVSVTIFGLCGMTGLHAGGLSLSQIGTGESVATAGVAGITNNHDASATISNPAGLAGIEQSSMVIGGQYLDVKSTFVRNESNASTDSDGHQFIPHLSYAKRINDDWVAGIALHSPGGLGVEYSNGLTGGPLAIADTNKITMMNLTTSAAYQVTERLSLGGSIIAQYAAIEVSALDGSATPLEVEGSNLAPTFAVAVSYALSASTDFGIKYQHGTEHVVELEQPVLGVESMALNWPASIDVGIKQALSDNFALMVNVGWQSWSDYDDKYSDTYSTGIALEYRLAKWTYQMGTSIDTSPLTAEDRDVVLPLNKQWRIGLGVERHLDNGSAISFAYQYQNLGDAEISPATADIIQPAGHYSTNRIHFFVMSYDF